MKGRIDLARWPLSVRPTLSRRLRWAAVTLLVVLLVAAGMVWWFLASRHFQPWQFLAHVEQIEAAGVDETNVQPLGWSLTILGRDHEVRDRDFFPQFQRPPSKVDAETQELTVVPWRDGLRRIAAEHRLVMIMEDHVVTKHREFVGATLSTFRDAGFTHYAAEAIGPVDLSLTQRGYPTSETGLYTSDPRFGNVLRRALELEFTVLGYDFRFTSHEAREDYAADRLARLLQHDAATRLVVHAGHAHVLKHKTVLGERWLASLLWEKTGIEPFTIWQWSRRHGAGDYEAVVRALQARGVDLNEPVLLMPPPASDCGLSDSPYGLGSVDAIVLHPPDESIAPARRTVLFPDAALRHAGRWTGTSRPVVVCAYRRGEPIEAIPLDQVMLRPNESEFVLWIPRGAEWEIRVFNKQGPLPAAAKFDGETLVVETEP